MALEQEPIMSNIGRLPDGSPRTVGGVVVRNLDGQLLNREPATQELIRPVTSRDLELDKMAKQIAHGAALRKQAMG